ncbi:amidase [Nocardioides sp. W7]|uniref:amidase n=1 Tax=Nocardioides sp. W7 TaxID=2931390 RepID=UPI001FD0A321|nr:amidase [Nocardioides sp. W7]
MTMPVTLVEAAAALASGSLTSVDLTTAALETIDRRDAELGAFVTVTAEPALAAARAADRAFDAGVVRGPLQGIPLAVKDNIATRDAPTTANSRVLAPGWGGGADATSVARLRAAGAVLVGKATTSEFACGLPDPALGFPIPRNPWDPRLTPSGSSAGTAIAVATGMALGGLGTDTAGSVRAPAAATGITGLKPTYGLVPTHGVVPLAPSLDTVGPMARSSRDCALLLQALAGPDRTDLRGAAVPHDGPVLDGDLTGLRVGLPRRGWLDDPAVSTEVAAALATVVDELAAAGADLVEVTVPLRSEAWHANNLIWLHEAFALHRADLATRWSDYGASTRETLARGAFVSEGDYARATVVRELFRRAAAVVFEEVDVLLTPYFVAPLPRWDEEDMGGLFSGTGFSGQWNLAGLPAMSLPCGVGVDGLPLSCQLVGRGFDEATLLRVADAYQRRTGWHRRVPPAGASTRH